MHKLTAGDGYLYLMRQVAASDATHRGRGSLGEYYSAKGESPGVWAGRGLAGLGMTAGEEVTEAQMLNLFGVGRHPNAEQIEAAVFAAPAAEVVGDRAAAAQRAAALGRGFTVYEGTAGWRTQLAIAYEAYNQVHGVPRDWAVPAAERDRLRSDVARRMFADEHGRAPASPVELTSYLARISRPQTTAVAGFDLTFSPVKSVSAAWAVADVPTAALIRQAHDTAVTATLEWLQEEVVHTRRGRNGVAQVKTHGLVIAQFTHRDARSGEPDLHTHAAVSNKVQATDGTWLALDGRAMYKYKVAASEMYNSVVEAQIEQLLGWQFDAIARTDGKRVVRELTHVPEQLRTRWSSRRVEIEARTGELAAAFVTDHGRVPTTVETLRLAQQATLETRQAKHEPRSEADQRATWHDEAVAVLGPDGLTRVLEHASTAVAYDPPTPEVIARFTAVVMRDVETQRAVWQHNHVLAEARRRLRVGSDIGRDIGRGPVPDAAAATDDGGLLPRIDPRIHDQVAEQITAAVLGASRPLTNPADRLTTHTPHALLRDLTSPDRESVYAHIGTQLYSSDAVLAAEQRLVDAAGQHDGWQISGVDVDLALLEFASTDPDRPRELNHAQAALVRSMATSGARLQLAIAPAGTGKTTAMGVLTAAVRHGGGTLLGLAPQAVQAEELAAATGARTDTLDKLVHEITHRDPRILADPRMWLTIPTADQPTAVQLGAQWDADLRAWFAPAGREEDLAGWRDWVTAIDERTLIVIDEAGRASTPHLDTAVQYALGRGASVRLIGDPAQFAATGAGGVLRDIDAEHGSLTLSEVVRFDDPVEALASLALREGDLTAIGFYLDHDRITVATTDSALDTVYDQWAAHKAAGRDAVMHADRLADVAALNARARTDRLTTLTGHELAELGRETTVGPGREVVSAGDLVITKRNDRTLALVGTDHVRNGHRWIVDTVHPDGSLTVIKHGTGPLAGRQLTLPADYVTAHVRLGYADTRASVQGTTAGRRGDIEGISITLVTPATETRNAFYTTMTRGTAGNYAVLVMPGTGIDSDQLTDRPTAVPDPIATLLAGVLARDGSAMSATSSERHAADPYAELGRAADAYLHSVDTAAVDLLSPEQVDELTAGAEHAVPGVTDEDRCPAWPTLLAHLAFLELDGRDAIAALITAATAREIGIAGDVAAVLDWRLDPTGNHSQQPGPLPWLPAAPTAVAEHPDWTDHLHDVNNLITGYADQLRTLAASWTPTTAPTWAQPYLTDDPDGRALLVDLTLWRAAHSVPAEDLTAAGPRPPGIARARLHAHLQERAIAAAGDRTDGAQRWARLLADLGVTVGAPPAGTQHVDTDPTWPVLAARLTLADSLGVDIAGLLADATSPTHPAGVLPHEHPSSALWWRLAQYLHDPLATAPAGSHHLRPPWTEQLPAAVGDAIADRITGDRLWPIIVARLDTATREGHSPAATLRGAAGMLATQTGHLHPDQLATALLWHISLLTDTHTDPDYEPPIPDPDAEHEHAPAGAEDLLHDMAYAASTTVTAPARTVPPSSADGGAGGGTGVGGGDGEDPFAGIPIGDEPDPDDLAPEDLEHDLPDRELKDLDQAFADQWLTQLADVDDLEVSGQLRADLPATQRVAALTDALTQARAELAELEAATRIGRGPHRTAAYDNYIRPLAERAEALHPLIAERDWAADIAAQSAARADTAEHELQHLTEQRDHALEHGLPVDELLTGGIAVAAGYARDYRRDADQQQTTLSAAQHALDQAAAGQPVITRDQITAMLDTAGQLDDDHARALRHNITTLDHALTRATWSREREHQVEADREPMGAGPVSALPEAVEHIGTENPVPDLSRDAPGSLATVDVVSHTSDEVAEPAIAVPAAPGQRWAQQLEDLVPGITADAGWAALADSLEQSHAAGYPLAQNLPAVIAQHPLPRRDQAEEVRLRLVEQCPAAATRVSEQTYRRHAQQVDEHARTALGSTVSGPEPGRDGPRRSR